MLFEALAFKRRHAEFQALADVCLLASIAAIWYRGRQ